MRYLVTGGAGFIGSHLLERLIHDEHDVVVLDDLSTGRRENLAPFGGSFTFIEGTITDLETCRRATTNVDYVLHQAALGSVPRSVEYPVPTHDANATGTLNLLVAAKEHGVARFVYAGSSSAYGDTPELPKRENMLPRPLSTYAVAKLCGEHYMGAFWKAYGLETVTLRYFNVFGPRQDPQSQYAAVIPRFISAALQGVEPTIYGDGEQTRDFTYVTNVVDANLRACSASGVAGRMFNVGGSHRTSLNELWQCIRTITGTSVEVRHDPPRAGDVRDSLADVMEAANALG